MAIITRDYAMRLVREGNADLTGHTLDNGAWYRVVTRYDLQRVDHYLVGDDTDDEEGTPSGE